MTDMPGKLTAWLGTQLSADDLRIEGLDRVEFGHSAEMMVLTIVTGANRRDVVVRLRPRPPALLEPYDLKRQFDILRSLEATPVRAPRALCGPPARPRGRCCSTPVTNRSRWSPGGGHSC